MQKWLIRVKRAGTKKIENHLVQNTLIWLVL